MFFSEFRYYQWFKVVSNCYTKFSHYNGCRTFYNAMDLSTHICDEFPLPNFGRDITILASIGMFFLMFVFFHSRLGFTTLIKAWNVSKLNLVRYWNNFFKNLPNFLFFIYPTALSYLHMLQTLGGMSKNFERIAMHASYSNVV